MSTDPNERFIVLDTLTPDRPLWRLTPAVDKIPAELDEVGRPLLTEEGRLVLWMTARLGIQLSLSQMPSPLVYRVNSGGGDA